MLTVRVYDNYNLIVLSGLDADDFEGCDFHGSLEPNLVEIWQNKWHVSDTKIIREVIQIFQLDFERKFSKM